jgi:fructose/tagatose bisphosphate aldolase
MTEITNAFAQLQKSGTEKIVFAHQEHSDQIVSHVQHLKFGITTQINASAQQLLMDLTVPPVLHQDHGTLTLINVCAQLQKSGTVNNVFVV